MYTSLGNSFFFKKLKIKSLDELNNNCSRGLRQTSIRQPQYFGKVQNFDSGFLFSN
jgi:hypothetical protein